MATRSESTIAASLLWNQSLIAGARVLFLGSEDHERGSGPGLRVALLARIGRSALLESTRMTHRIERSTNAPGRDLHSQRRHGPRSCHRVGGAHGGRVQSPRLSRSRDVTLVNREAIGFLAGVEAAGATLVNCPEYVRELD